MVCIFCLKETNDNVSLYGDSEMAKQARNVVTKHFWFDVNDINSIGKCACRYCWSEVESFYDFYGMVESNYPNFLNVIDAIKDLDNPSMEGAGTASFVNEIPVIKVEHAEVDFSTAGYDSDEVPSSSNSVDSKVEVDEMANSLIVEPIDDSDEIASISQSNELEKERDLDTAITPSTTQEDKKDAKYFCKVCQRQYSEHGFRSHIAKHDPEESFILECDVCGKKFSRKTILRSHLKAHFRYKNCDKTKFQAPCPICKKIMSRNNVDSHILRVHENKKLPLKYVCEVCGKGFSSPSALVKHRNQTHIDRSQTEVQCNVCGKWQKNQYSMLAHKKTHKQAAQKCPHPNCDKLAYNPNEMKTHLSQFHAQHKHQCSICKKSFIRPIRLREHIASAHTGERAYKCLYCSKDFKTNSSRFRHMQDLHPKEYSLDRERRKSK